MEMLDRLYVTAMIKAQKAKEDVKEFFTKQDGISNVVATIIILLLVVLLIAAFWDRLKGFVDGIMDRIFDETTFDNSGLD